MLSSNIYYNDLERVQSIFTTTGCTVYEKGFGGMSQSG
jgi:hypothetical protein